MPITDDDTYAQFFLNTASNVVMLETLVLMHSSFSQTYRVVNNALSGITIGGNFYTYYPMSIEPASTSDDLDYQISVTFGDLGEILPVEIDRLANDATFDEYIQIVYSVYQSDSLSTALLSVNLEVKSLSFDETGCLIQGSPKAVSNKKIGEFYTIARFPPLAGFK